VPADASIRQLMVMIVKFAVRLVGPLTTQLVATIPLAVETVPPPEIVKFAGSCAPAKVPAAFTQADTATPAVEFSVRAA
jgi:Ni,Fe-hydrogenase III small subunit